MYRLIGKDKNGKRVILDENIPDDFAAEHSAEDCGRVWRDYSDFKLEIILLFFLHTSKNRFFLPYSSL